MIHTRSQLRACQSTNEAATVFPPESSLGTAQLSSIELNWILFDKSHRIPYIISIPSDLYERPSQYCRQLFVEELHLRYKVSAETEDIVFWTAKDPVSIKAAAEEGWEKSIDASMARFTPVPLPLSFSKELEVDNNELVHLVITIRDDGSLVGQSGIDAVPGLKEFKRYEKTVLTPGMRPSEGAKPTAYGKIQIDDAQAIYDGQGVPNEVIPSPTIAPPIQIFHPIFNEFIHLVNDPDVQVTADDLLKVQDFMCYASELGDKWDYEEQRYRLRCILQDDIYEEPNPLRIGFLVIQLDRELGEANCDPTIRAGLSMKCAWIEPSRKAIREKSCCPTFLVAGGGPWISILGGVFTDKFIVQRLTDMMWMALSSSREDSRIYHNARVLIALRKCLVKLQNFYLGLQDIPPFVANKPHPRYFPYPTSFKAQDGSLTRFRYLTSLEDNAACVTYLAEIPDVIDIMGNPVKVVVKFVARYGKEVHEFLARNGFAPTLRYCGPLPETKLSGILPGPAQYAPPGLCLRSDRMHMVVMDYIHPQRNPPPDVREQIRAILTLLHSEGYVFGDLRKQNIIFDADGKVRFIDFDWCGRYNMKIRDEKLPKNLQDQIDKNLNRVQVGDGPYAYYPLSMSRIEGPWAPGMEALEEIRPQHDWMMFDKLSWE